jgi:hypothetical protein
MHVPVLKTLDWTMPENVCNRLLRTPSSSSTHVVGAGGGGRGDDMLQMLEGFSFLLFLAAGHETLAITSQ